MKTESSSILLSPDVPFPSANPLASRVFSASELLLGAFIVIGHNVFHIVPNEVIVLCVLGFVSVRLRDGRWAAMGFKPTSVLAPYFPHRSGSGRFKNSPRPICD